MMFVDRNAALVILDSCRFQVQAFQVGHSSRCHHDLIDDKFVFVIAMLDDTMQTTVFLLDFLQLRTKTNIDAFFLEDFQHDFTRFRVVFVHDPVATLQDRDIGTQPPHRMSQLTSDRSATDHHELMRQLRQTEKRFARQAVFSQAGDVWNEWPATSANHAASEFDFCPIEIQSIRTSEFRISEKYVDSQVSQLFRTVVMSHVGADPAQPFHHSAEVDAHVVNVDAKLTGFTSRVCDVS